MLVVVVEAPTVPWANLGTSCHFLWPPFPLTWGLGWYRLGFGFLLFEAECVFFERLFSAQKSRMPFGHDVPTLP